MASATLRLVGARRAGGRRGCRGSSRRTGRSRRSRGGRREDRRSGRRRHPSSGRLPPGRCGWSEGEMSAPAARRGVQWRQRVWTTGDRSRRSFPPGVLGGGRRSAALITKATRGRGRRTRTHRGGHPGCRDPTAPSTGRATHATRDKLRRSPSTDTARDFEIPETVPAAGGESTVWGRGVRGGGPAAATVVGSGSSWVLWIQRGAVSVEGGSEGTDAETTAL